MTAGERARSGEDTAAEEGIGDSPQEPGPDRAAVIVVCPDGPLLVRGDFAVVDATGREVPGARRTSALCRCGKSREKPFCDGSHKAARFRAP
ncbi:MAG: CDGSH iron-sulfur domain-containing protein [Austwickia sp.]|jgi:hypothetical protein|nr:MAG: CDGSH iron-sulfur domain-containing protein [Austwickia sp.]